MLAVLSTGSTDMATGVKFISDGGVTQLTEQFRHFCLQTKGSVTLGAPFTSSVSGMSYISGPGATITIPDVTGYPPILALYSTVPVTYYTAALSGSNWVFQIVGEFGSAQGAVVNWYSFIPTPNVSPDNYGLIVRAADGSLVYHSSYKSMRVTWALSGNTEADASVGLPSGTYAVALCLQSMRVTAPVPAGTWRVNLFARMVQTNGNVVTSNFKQYVQVTYSAFPSYATEANYPDWSVLAIDVTNY